MYYAWQQLRFQSADDGKELPIVDIIVSFCRDEQLGEVGTRMPITIDICLEDSARSILGGIGGNGKGFGKVGKVEDRTRQEELFQQVKELLVGREVQSQQLSFLVRSRRG